MNDPPLTPPSEYFFERSPWNNKKVLFCIALLVACSDFFAGPIIFFPFLFVIPVTLMAWNCGLRTALWLGAALCIIRFCIQYAWGIPLPLHVAVINAIIRLAILFTIIFLCGKLSEQTQALRARVRKLEGLLPTCSHCKNIRDDAGLWHQMEDYIATHSGAQFTHGICPTCVAKHFDGILSTKEETADPAASPSPPETPQKPQVNA